MPTFAQASTQKDPVDALRRLAPYAQAVEASVKAFAKSGRHEAWDIGAFFGAIQAVGYQSTISIDYAGKTDPLGNIESARDLIAGLIEPAEAEEEEVGAEEGD
jgi:hypothetical protein